MDLPRDIEERSVFYFERAKLLSSSGSGLSIELERILIDTFRAVALVPNQVHHYMFLGKIYKRAADATSAIFCYRFIINLDPSDVTARGYLCELLLIRGQELMTIAAKSSSVLKFQAARACFDEVLEYIKDNTRIWVLKCICHVHANELVEAYEAIDRVIKPCYVVTAEMYILRAKVLWGRGLTEQGNADIRLAGSIDPNHPEVINFSTRSFQKAEKLYNESVRDFTAGKYAEALLSINHAIHITAEDVKLLLMQSKIHRKMCNLQAAYDSMLKAQAIFTKAFEGTEYPMELPSDIILQINLILNDMSIDYALKGDYDKAILLLNKVIKTELSVCNRGGIQKVDHKYYINRGDCYRALNRLADAKYDYDLAHELQPNDWEIKTRLSLTHYLIATNYFNESMFIEAQMELTKAIGFNPKARQRTIKI